MSERDRRRSLLLVALIFALGIAVPKLVGAPAGGRASVAAAPRATVAARHADTPQPTRAPSTRDLAFAG